MYQLLAADGAAISVISNIILAVLISSWLREILFYMEHWVHLRWTFVQDRSTKYDVLQTLSMIR